MIVLLLAGALTLSTPDLSVRVRDKHGNLVRSQSRRHLFMRMTGHPNGRPGYVIDHLVPLACGGFDGPSNMTWLPIAEWKAKSLWERQPCSAWWDGTNTRAIAAAREKK